MDMWRGGSVTEYKHHCQIELHMPLPGNFSVGKFDPMTHFHLLNETVSFISMYPRINFESCIKQTDSLLVCCIACDLLLLLEPLGQNKTSAMGIWAKHSFDGNITSETHPIWAPCKIRNASKECVNALDCVYKDMPPSSKQPVIKKHLSKERIRSVFPQSSQNGSNALCIPSSHGIVSHEGHRNDGCFHRQPPSPLYPPTKEGRAQSMYYSPYTSHTARGSSISTNNLQEESATTLSPMTVCCRDLKAKSSNCRDARMDRSEARDPESSCKPFSLPLLPTHVEASHLKDFSLGSKGYKNASLHLKATPHAYKNFIATQKNLRNEKSFPDSPLCQSTRCGSTDMSEVTTLERIGRRTSSCATFVDPVESSWPISRSLGVELDPLENEISFNQSGRRAETHLKTSKFRNYSPSASLERRTTPSKRSERRRASKIMKTLHTKQNSCEFPHAGISHGYKLKVHRLPPACACHLKISPRESPRASSTTILPCNQTKKPSFQWTDEHTLCAHSKGMGGQSSWRSHQMHLKPSTLISASAPPTASIPLSSTALPTNSVSVPDTYPSHLTPPVDDSSHENLFKERICSGDPWEEALRKKNTIFSFCLYPQDPQQYNFKEDREASLYCTQSSIRARAAITPLESSSCRLLPSPCISKHSPHFPAKPTSPPPAMSMQRTLLTIEKLLSSLQDRASTSSSNTIFPPSTGGAKEAFLTLPNTQPSSHQTPFQLPLKSDGQLSVEPFLLENTSPPPSLPFFKVSSRVANAEHASTVKPPHFISLPCLTVHPKESCAIQKQIHLLEPSTVQYTGPLEQPPPHFEPFPRRLTPFASCREPAVDTYEAKQVEINPTITSVRIYEPTSILLGDQLSKGGFGTVYKARIQGKCRAVKICYLRLQHSEYLVEQLSSYIREIVAYRLLKHDSIVRFFGICIENCALAIVTEYFPKGNLYNLLHKTHLAEPPLRLKWAIQLLEVVTFFHNHQPRILHGDLKTANLLLDNDMNLRVCDFGKTRIMEDAAKQLYSIYGSPRYMAPECFSKFSKVDQKADIWSLEMVFVL
ncbi:hypothetical protein IE077_004143 [Cardiosporidium cionae]|uniref:Protein kinase domain-containing protein n=1 Tax=Cardiosporidium cionae TaxID=476202 RepID=A0ABQ7JE24_9APIC|nr:hypothetical protein IE077_004143 [Cardiosporidium cionae]|eukprot:KAF8822267.1 hypothetical protein IE077_004143 [Cardiosporidium cionae]